MGFEPNEEEKAILLQTVDELATGGLQLFTYEELLDAVKEHGIGKGKVHCALGKYKNKYWRPYSSTRWQKTNNWSVREEGTDTVIVVEED